MQPHPCLKESKGQQTFISISIYPSPVTAKLPSRDQIIVFQNEKKNNAKVSTPQKIQRQTLLLLRFISLNTYLVIISTDLYRCAYGIICIKFE